MTYDIILCGPIAGYADYKAAFGKVKAELRQEWIADYNRRVKAGEDPKALKYLPEVWNPAEMPDGREYAWYMRQCVEAIMGSPQARVVMLPGWSASPGATAEWALARCLGMRIDYLP